MKNIILVSILIVFSWQGRAQYKNFIDQPYLETKVEVDTLVTPDEIFLRIHIKEKDSKNKKSVEEQEVRMEKKLKSLGIDTKEQLTLADAGSNFKDYFLRKNNVLKDKVYMLKVGSAEMAGKVLVGLESIEISNVDLQKVQYSKLKSLQLDLKKLAVQKAKKQADALLAPLGQKSGKAIHITDVNSYGYASYANESRGMARMSITDGMQEEYAPITIDFEKIKVQSSVSIKFTIE